MARWVSAVLLAGVSAIVLAAGAARADVVISKKATANMSCSGGVCSPTAKDAVLNATDLASMLASGDVEVTTGSLAKDIDIHAPVSWAAASRLTLDAQRSVVVKTGISVTGAGALTVTTHDGSKDGEFVIVPEQGSVQFWDLSSSLIIDGQGYTLVGDIKTLAADIAANPSGFYALAKPYDASADGTYSSAPIGASLAGKVDGLGNAVSGIIVSANGAGAVGLFGLIQESATLRHLGVQQASFNANDYTTLGLLAGVNQGAIDACWTVGSMEFFVGDQAGGLVGFSSGTIVNSYASVTVRGNNGTLQNVGGLVGGNKGTIRSSYSLGSVGFKGGSELNVGGIVGQNDGTVQNAFARNHVIDGKRNGSGHFGGFAGQNGAGARIDAVYAAGKISERGEAVLGGLVGFDDSAPGNISNAYWDLDQGIGDPSRGAGNISNDPGIKGLTTQELQAGLPRGLEPQIWGEKTDTNKGLPYLLVIPPK